VNKKLDRKKRLDSGIEADEAAGEIPEHLPPKPDPLAPGEVPGATVPGSNGASLVKKYGHGVLELFYQVTKAFIMGSGGR
jgi:hypothetical protein